MAFLLGSKSCAQPVTGHILCNATSLPQPDKCHYTTKVFLSRDVTPAAAVLFSSYTIDLPEIDRQVSFTFDCPRRYSEHIPHVSSGFRSNST
mmetsp:Transcript_7660/g.11610  ORF Transcript_7660/g.11610 Transcript_7660/m.11610 type:complete len:92 (-) Transcript_7660:2209-2484(-)